jgi:hypothetical protein
MYKKQALTSRPQKNDDYLTLVDGSETGETIPLRPLMTPHRAVDFIIAYDASSDSGEYDWVNGTNLYNTHLAARESGGELLFPDIPDVRTLINSNATQKPTFFGCNATDDKIPLVLYLPNYPWSAYSNYSVSIEYFSIIDNSLTNNPSTKSRPSRTSNSTSRSRTPSTLPPSTYLPSLTLSISHAPLCPLAPSPPRPTPPHQSTH